MALILSALLRYWYLVLASVVVVVALAAVDRSGDYESRARLLYKLGDDFLQTGVGPNARVTGRIQLAEAINSEVQILTSDDRLLEVVEVLGSDFFIEPDAVLTIPRREAAASALRSGLNVRSVENSAVIHLTYSDDDPEQARTALETLIEVYFRQRESLLNDENVDVITHLRDEAQGTFESAELAYDSFLQSGQSRDPGAALVRLQNLLASLSGKTLEARQSLQEDEQKLAIIESEIAEQPTQKAIYSESHASSATEKARTRLVELRVDEKQLLAKFTPDSRAVTRVRTEIEELERILASEGSRRSLAIERTGTNPVRDSLDLQRSELKVRVAGARARLGALESQRDGLRSELADLELRNFEGSKLRDALTLATNRLRNVEEQFFEQRLRSETLAARRTSVRVIETPSMPRGEAGLGLRDRVILGVIIGAIVGAILALWMELYRRFVGSNRASRRASPESEAPRPGALVDPSARAQHDTRSDTDSSRDGELVRVRNREDHDRYPQDDTGDSVPVLGEFRRVS